MKVKDYLETQKILIAAGCKGDSGALDVTRIKKFLDNKEQFLNNCEAILDLFENKPFPDTKVVIDKEGKVYLTNSYKLNISTDKPEEEVTYEGINVIDVTGNPRTLPIGEVAPYNDKTKVLYGKK